MRLQMRELLLKEIEILLKCKLLQNEQVTVNRSAMKYSVVRVALLQMSQAITTQALAITSQANMEVIPRENRHSSTMASRLRDFMRMNPPMFFRCKVDEDPLDLHDEVYKIFFAMGVSTTEKAKLFVYQLNDVASTWYNQWKDSRAVGVGSVTSEIFKKTSLDRFFPRKQRESKVKKFINLRQGDMNVKECSLKFIKL